MVSVPLQDFAWQDSASWTEVFHCFVDAVRAGIAAYRVEVATDLDLALARYESATPAVKRTLQPHLGMDTARHPHEGNGNHHGGDPRGLGH
jgi:hypothetical protein